MTPASHPEPQPHYCEHPPGDLRTGCPNWPACVPPVRSDTLRVRGVARPITFDTAPLDPDDAMEYKRRFIAAQAGMHHAHWHIPPTTPAALTAALDDEPDDDDVPGAGRILATLIGIIGAGVLGAVVAAILVVYFATHD